MARKKTAIDRRQVIIDGARELFGRYGFEKTTVDDIARHTGIGKGSVYLEFKTKEDILIGIIDQFANQMHHYLDECVETASPPYLDALGEMMYGICLRIYDTATSNIHTPEVMMLTHNKMRKEFSHHYEFKHSRLKALVKKAAKNGEISTSASYESITHYIELVTACLLPPYIRKEPEGKSAIPTRTELEQDAKEVISILTNGIRAKYKKKKKLQ